jgi:Family of unknown function (DUF6580)
MHRDRLISAAVFVALVTLAIAVRLVSETPNFGAVTAAALFAGFYFRSRMTALCVPLLAVAVSDLSLGGYAKAMMAAVYLSHLMPIAWRGVLRRRLSPLSVGAAALCSSLTFYVLSNAAVWYAWYPSTWQGLTECYITALPFFVNSIKSDLLFSAGFFGLYALAVQFSAPRAASPAPQTA